MILVIVYSFQSFSVRRLEAFVLKLKGNLHGFELDLDYHCLVGGWIS